MHVIHDVNLYKLKSTAKIRDAAKIMQLTNLKIALICDDQNRLVGTVTDGDIRRGVLYSFNADTSITEVMNKMPRVISQQEDDVDKVYFQMRELVIKHMPVVDQAGRVIKVYFYDEFEEHIPIDNPILLMAGGYGKRLRPLTNNLPKPLIEIGGKPVILHLIEWFKKQGFWKFYISVNYLGHMIKSYLGNGYKYGVTIEYLIESKPLGTAGCLSMLTNIDKPILVMNGDLVTKENFCRALTCFNENNVVASMGVKDYIHTVPFGCVETRNQRILSISEKPSYQYLINAGVYILSPGVLDYVPHNTFFDMPDLFNLVIKDKKPVGLFHLHEEWIDIGQKEDLKKSKLIYEKESLTID